ncbi:hypothetical protein ACH5RR_038796 [Cinchona calisaya]|uniref:Wall-associated receptor kinase galacturonan-binding domain-containing protein n=1 Tax=Cinchona calisaya TaxID=153742 RepID=A0ABD2XXQ2_9GENT
MGRRKKEEADSAASRVGFRFCYSELVDWVWVFHWKVPRFPFGSDNSYFKRSGLNEKVDQAAMSKGKLSLVLVLLFLTTSCCTAKKSNHQCSPSSCGDIPNISYPFPLKGDPENCGNSSYELDCNNNRTLSLSLNSKIHHVLEIDYAKYRIRVVDRFGI